MSHVFVNKYQWNDQNANPISLTFTPGGAATGAILTIVTPGTTARTGGAPTIDGVAATAFDIRRVGVEQAVEGFYVCKAFDGSQFGFTVPNDGAVLCHIEIVMCDAGAGNASAFQSASGAADTGAGNGFSINVASAAVGDFLCARVGSGENAPASVTQTAGSPTKTLTYANDHGAYSSRGDYGISDGAGTETFTYVWSGDDGCGIAVCLKSVAAPTIVDLASVPATAASSGVDPSVVFGSAVADLANVPAESPAVAIDPGAVLGSISIDLMSGLN